MKKSLYLILTLFFINYAWAAKDEPEYVPPPEQCDVNFATGPKGKGYSIVFEDIKKLCGSRVNICEVESEGGLQNLSLLGTKDADLAFVQVDTMKQMSGSDDNIKRLQVVGNMHTNMLHIITLTSGFNATVMQKVDKKAWEVWKDDQVKGSRVIQVENFSDLKGRRVGLVGSAQLLVRALDKMSGHGMQFVDFSGKTADQDAINAMKKGEVYAVFTLGAWPHGYVKKMTQKDGVKLIGYDLAPASPYEIVKKNYSSLGQYGVQFLAARNLIMTRPFDPNGDNARNVAALRSCIASNLSKFKDGKFQAGWSEVDNFGATHELPAFQGPKKK